MPHTALQSLIRAPLSHLPILKSGKSETTKYCYNQIGWRNFSKKARQGIFMGDISFVKWFSSLLKNPFQPIFLTG